MNDVEARKLPPHEVVDDARAKVATDADGRRERRAAAFRTMAGVHLPPARDGRR